MSDLENFWQYDSRPNFMLYLSILRTCKRLLDEGGKMLYSNTVRLHVLHDPEVQFLVMHDHEHRQPRSVQICRLTKATSLQPALAGFYDRFANIEVVVNSIGQIQGGSLRRPLSGLVEALHALCEVMDQSMTLKARELSIQICPTYALCRMSRNLWRTCDSELYRQRYVVEALRLLNVFRNVCCNKISFFIDGKSIKPA